MATTLFPLLDVAAAASLTRPSGYQTAWDSTNAAAGGANAAILSPYRGRSGEQSAVSGTITASTSLKTFGFGQFCTWPLLASTGVIGAANWTVCGAISTAAFTNGQARLYVSIYLMKSDGTIRTTIVNNVQVGTSAASTTEHTRYSATVAGSAATPQDGDYLMAELAVGLITSLGTTTTTATGYSSGGTLTLSDNTAATDVEAEIVCPTTLVFNSTSLYPLLGSVAPAAITKPGTPGGWTTTVAGTMGANSKLLSTTPGTSQVSQACAAITATTTVQHTGFGQFCTVALAGGTYPADTWILTGALSTSPTNAAVLERPEGRVTLMKADGTARTVLRNRGQFGSSGFTGSTTERLFIAMAALVGFTAQDGDYLSLELGAQAQTSSGSVAITTTGYTSGNVLISDDGTGSDARVALIYPGPLRFYTNLTLTPATATGALGQVCLRGALVLRPPATSTVLGATRTPGKLVLVAAGAVGHLAKHLTPIGTDNFTDPFTDTAHALGPTLSLNADAGTDYDGDTSRLQRNYLDVNPTYVYEFLPGVTYATFNYFLSLTDPGPIGAVDFAGSADGVSFSAITSSATDNGPTSTVLYEKWAYALLPPAGTNVLRASLTEGLYGSYACQLSSLVATILATTTVQSDGGSGVTLTNCASDSPSLQDPDTAIVTRATNTSAMVVAVALAGAAGSVGVSWHHYPQDPSPLPTFPTIESSPDGTTWTSQSVGTLSHGNSSGVSRHWYSMAVLPAGTLYVRATWAGDSTGQDIDVNAGLWTFGAPAPIVTLDLTPATATGHLGATPGVGGRLTVVAATGHLAQALLRGQLLLTPGTATGQLDAALTPIVVSTLDLTAATATGQLAQADQAGALILQPVSVSGRIGTALVGSTALVATGATGHLSANLQAGATALVVGAATGRLATTLAPAGVRLTQATATGHLAWSGSLTGTLGTASATGHLSQGCLAAGLALVPGSATGHLTGPVAVSGHLATTRATGQLGGTATYPTLFALNPATAVGHLGAFAFAIQKDLAAETLPVQLGASLHAGALRLTPGVASGALAGFGASSGRLVIGTATGHLGGACHGLGGTLQPVSASGHLAGPLHATTHLGSTSAVGRFDLAITERTRLVTPGAVGHLGRALRPLDLTLLPTQAAGTIALRDLVTARLLPVGAVGLVDARLAAATTLAAASAFGHVGSPLVPIFADFSLVSTPAVGQLGDRLLARGQAPPHAYTDHATGHGEHPDSGGGGVALADRRSAEIVLQEFRSGTALAPDRGAGVVRRIDSTEESPA